MTAYSAKTTADSVTYYNSIKDNPNISDREKNAARFDVAVGIVGTVVGAVGTAASARGAIRASDGNVRSTAGNAATTKTTGRQPALPGKNNAYQGGSGSFVNMMTPGTRSIIDVKLGEKGEMYYRETIFDEYGRKIGINDYGDHGRPDIPSHTIPHHHSNPVDDPSQHDHGEPGLHPQTPK